MGRSRAIRKPPPPVAAVLAVLSIVSAVFAWRDLAGRPSGTVRGSKKMWRALLISNPGNSIAYWVLGRR